jgi:Protein of unknown function (DUF2490)
MFLYKKIIFVFLLCIFAKMGTINAQTLSQNNNVWLHYAGKNMLTSKLSVTLEASMRFANGFNEKQQWFIRPSVDYQFTKHFTGSLGYTHYNTYVYGNPAINKTDIPEDHIWLQGTFVHQKGDLKITNRLRDENRNVGIAVGTKNATTGETTYAITNYEYRNRLRYMLLLQYPIIKKDGKPILNALFGDEVFLNIGTQSGVTLLNQNRVIAGLGYPIDAHQQIQLAYIHQNIWNKTNTIEEINPTVRLSYLTNFSFVQSKNKPPK